MGYIIAVVIGLIGGSIGVYVAFDPKRKQIEATRVQQGLEAERLKNDRAKLEIERKELIQNTTEAQNLRSQFDLKIVTYTELQQENAILKTDLLAFEIQRHKIVIDQEASDRKQAEVLSRVQALGTRFLKDNVKWIMATIKANNFSLCKDRLQSVIDSCRKIGFEISPDDEESLMADLRVEFEKAVRAEFEREEQSRIKAQIREEERLKREVEREITRLEREKEIIRVALAKALTETHETHSAEIEQLRIRLAEAEAKEQRAISQAQLTKAGYVYVISNVGSFGEEVFKIGMTRRLEPNDRIRELGDASVPFPFDIHMMISAKDAPALENALHRSLHLSRLNKANPRKEFFRARIDEILGIVKANHGDVEYVADPEAIEYRQSLEMKPDDVEFIERVYERAEEELSPG